MLAYWVSEQQEEQKYQVTCNTYQANVPGPPRFTVLQAMKAGRGTGNECIVIALNQYCDTVLVELKESHV